MLVRIYLRASTKDQNVDRALDSLKQLVKNNSTVLKTLTYRDMESGTILNRPALNTLLNEAEHGDILLVESVDRLSRLNQAEFDILKNKIKSKGLHLVVADLPTTHQVLTDRVDDSIQNQLMSCISNMLIDLLATMAKIDNDKRIDRINQGIARKKLQGWKPEGKKPNLVLHGKIKELLQEKRLKKSEIADKLKCGVATVYRIAKNE